MAAMKAFQSALVMSVWFLRIPMGVSFVCKQDCDRTLAAQRLALQLPRARCTRCFQKTNDLAREAVNCNHPSGRPYVGTAETALPSASSATILPRQSSDPNTDWCD